MRNGSGKIDNFLLYATRYTLIKEIYLSLPFINSKKYGRYE